MNTYKILIPFTSLLITTHLLTGCSPAATDEEKIGDAQFCLDDIPISGLTHTQRSSQINSCLSKLNGVVSKQADLIRCSSGFMIEGFADPAKLTQIAKQVSNSNQDPTTTLMSILRFKYQGDENITDDEDKAFAQKTFDYCHQSGSSGYSFVASIANMATVIASITGGDDIEAGIANLINDPNSELATASAEVIGATALVAYQAHCVANNEEKNAEICTQLNSAITSGNGIPTEIGASLLDIWNSMNNN